MTTIRWLGPALAGAAVIAAIVAQAAPGDPVWIARTAAVELSVPQTQGLAAWVTSIWPDATPSQVRELHCARQPVRCRIITHETVSEEQYVVDEAAGKSLGFVSSAEGAVTYRYSTGYLVLSPAQKLSLIEWLETVWPDVDVEAAQGLLVRREEGPVFPAVLEYLTSGSASEYAAALSAGSVVSRAGTVQ